MNVQSLQSYIEGRLPFYLDMLRQMVAINSFTANPLGVNTLGEVTARLFADLGFAAETENLLEYASRKLKDKNLDLIVANDVANPSIGFNSEENAITVIDRDLGQSSFAQTSKGKIARQLIAFIADRLNQA